MKKLISVCLVGLLAACSNPTVNTNTVNDDPTLSFLDAPSGAEVFVNGLNVGMAADFDGEPDVLMVPRGTHMVEVRHGAQILLSQKVFVSDGSNKMFNLKGLK